LFGLRQLVSCPITSQRIIPLDIISHRILQHIIVSLLQVPLLNTKRPKLVARAAAIIARVAQHGTATEVFHKEGALLPLLSLTTGADAEGQEPAVRALAAMATKSPAVVEELGKSKLFAALPKQIAEMDGSAVGNLCMVISQCAGRPEYLKKLSPCVKPLVTLMHAAANDNRKTVAKNAAIALAKLAKEPGNLEAIRELHGIEIMFAYIKP